MSDGKDLTDDDKIEKFKTFGKILDDHDGKIIKNENDEIIKVNFFSYSKLLQFANGLLPLICVYLSMCGFSYCEIKTDYVIGQWADLGSG